MGRGKIEEEILRRNQISEMVKQLKLLHGWTQVEKQIYF
jgi:hypothetical protein